MFWTMWARLVLLGDVLLNWVDTVKVEGSAMITGFTTGLLYVSFWRTR